MSEGDRIESHALRGLVDDASLLVGIQAAVAYRGRVATCALGVGGTGRPITDERRLRIHCTGKPYTALALLHLLSEAGIDPAEPLGTRLGRAVPGLPAHCAEYSVLDLLSHRTNLIEPKGLDVPGLGVAEIVRAVEGRAHAYPPAFLGYSEMATWIVVSRVVEHALGRPVAPLIQTLLAEDLALERTTFGVTGGDAALLATEVEVNVRLRDRRRIPMLAERNPEAVGRFEPAAGGYSTASDLVSFWSQITRGSGDIGGPTAPARMMLHHRRGRTFDHGVKLTCDFGPGVMRGLPDHWGDCGLSDDSYGHSGLMGASFAFVEPEEEIVGAAIFLGMSDVETHRTYLRPLVVQELLRWGRRL